MVFCPHCGKEMSEEDRFCRSCGQTLQMPNVQETISQVPTKLEVEQTQSILSKYIRPGEKVLWAAKPVKVPFIVSSLRPIPVLFGLIFMIIPAFMLSAFMTSGAPWFLQLFLLPFFLVGFFRSFGPLVWRLMRVNKTDYMITDQRMITQTGAIGRDTLFVDLEKIQEVYVEVGFFDKIYGTGSVITSTAANVDIGRGRGSRAYHFLLSLREPYDIQRLLQEAVKNARTSGNRLMSENNDESQESHHPLYGSTTWKKYEYLLKVISLIIGLMVLGWGSWIVYDTVQRNSGELGKILLGLFFAFVGCYMLYILFFQWEQMKKESERRWLSGEEDYDDD